MKNQSKSEIERYMTHYGVSYLRAKEMIKRGISIPTRSRTTAYTINWGLWGDILGISGGVLSAIALVIRFTKE